MLSRNVKRFRGELVFKAHRLFYHSALGLRVIKKKKKGADEWRSGWGCFFFVTLVTGPRRSLSLKLSDTRVYEPQIRLKGADEWRSGRG